MKNIYKDVSNNFQDMRIITEREILLEMSDLSPKDTGLKVVIWSENNGTKRKNKDKKERVKLESRSGAEVSISIESKPRVLASTKNIKQNDQKAFEEAMQYVGKNYDLFLKHYTSSVFDYDIDDLKNDLMKRG